MERAGNPISPAVASALQWWTDAGVDVMVDEQPRDWLRPQGKTAPIAAPVQPIAETLPDQLELFQAYLRDHANLPYASPNARRVCPSGDPASGLMMMSDMPSAEDCAAGTLFAGDVGRLFDRMLTAIGRERGSIYLAGLSCLRSPDGRMTGQAGTQCATLARHHIGLVQPRALLLFGDGASKALLGLSVAQARGRWHEVATHAGPVKALATIAPAQLLNRPQDKALAWADLQLLMQGLQG